ncbi:unnamed protein product [Sphagnum troendelagicum]|uniref:Uncharacterized protein n=1 Tax=Sphagnum troendelagicum TaxID=128251 RepID=A0ABP0U187_9BRYO
MQTAVHQLWPPPGDMRKIEMNILFFHSYPRDPDEWKSSWTQRGHPDVCWPEKWLPADLGVDVRVLFVSYNIGQSRAADVADDLFKALVIRDQWDLCKNHQPLVLVGRDFGTQVLDNLFLKATEEAGAFVRNVKSVILYGDKGESYRLEKFFGGRSEHTERVRIWTCNLSERHAVSIMQGSILINPAIHGKNLTQEVVGMGAYRWSLREMLDDWKWGPNGRWKPESKRSRGYSLLLESCRIAYQFEAIRAILEHLQQKLDNITTACGISNYSDSMFENEFTYLRHNGFEGAKILIVQRMLATMGVDVEQHMAAKKSDDGEQLENERKLAILKFSVARFCDSHEWHMVPFMRESDMQQKIESSVNDIVDGIPPLSEDVVIEKMQREWDSYHNVPIHFPSIREQSIMSVKQLQQLACYMRPGGNLPQEDVQEQLTAHMAQVLHGGKLIVTAKILEGKIQFLFGNAKSMAQIVGVGLEFATVSLTRQNVIVVEGITELEWTRLWGEVFLGKSLFENPIFMEKVVFSPPVHEKPQGAHVNALSKVAMFFMIEKFLQNLDVGKVYNQVVRGVATTMTEENQPDIGQVHAKIVNDPSTGILGFNLWDYFSRLQITRGLGSATRDTSGEGVSHLGGRDTPSEGDKDQGGDGGEDDDNRKGRGAKGKEIQKNNQWDVLVTVHPGYEHGVWNRDPVPEQLEESYITPILQFLFKKTEKQQSCTIESKIEVRCDMNTSSPDQVNDCLKRFGWCQNHLHVALQCFGHDAATLCGSSLLGTREAKDTYMEQTQATSSQATIGLTGGFHGFATISASFMKPLLSSLQSNQRVIEIPCEVISGTGFQPECHDLGGPTPILRYDFKFRPELPTNRFPDRPDQKWYDGMRCTVYPHFKGIWGLLSEDEECKYELRVERHVCELVCVDQSLKPKKWSRGKQKLLCNCNTMLQTYKVTLYINHKMSNIETLPEFGTDTLSKAYPKNAFMKLSVDPSVCGSHYASSSTQ